MLSEVEPNWHHCSPAVANQPRTVGNPRFEIPREQLLYLVDYEITIPDMSRALEGCPILSSRFHRKKGSYESLDSSNGESLWTIRHVELSIGKVHLIRGT